VFGAPRAVAVWSKSGRLIGLFPARVERRYGVMGALTGWIHPYAPFGVPLVDRDEADAAMIGLLDHAEAEGTLLMLPLIAAEGPFAAALSRVLLRRGGAMERYDTHARALLAPDGVRKTYLDRAMSPKKLKELRRQHHRLSEHGAVTLRLATTPQDVAHAIETFLVLEASGWKADRGTALIQHEGDAAFIRRATPAMAARRQCEVITLSAGETPVAAGIVLRHAARAFWFKLGVDERFAKYSPGVQLALELTRHLCADGAVTSADSTALPGHPMIEPIWRGRLPIGDLVIPLKRNDPGVALTIATLRARASLRAKLRNAVRYLRPLKEKRQ